jgi:hypothetical protein
VNVGRCAQTLRAAPSANDVDGGASGSRDSVRPAGGEDAASGAAPIPWGVAVLEQRRQRMLQAAAAAAGPAAATAVAVGGVRRPVRVAPVVPVGAPGEVRVCASVCLRVCVRLCVFVRVCVCV